MVPVNMARSQFCSGHLLGRRPGAKRYVLMPEAGEKCGHAASVVLKLRAEVFAQEFFFRPDADCGASRKKNEREHDRMPTADGQVSGDGHAEIGRASCRERV